jgi:hypothetical protein
MYVRDVIALRPELDEKIGSLEIAENEVSNLKSIYKLPKNVLLQLLPSMKGVTKTIIKSKLETEIHRTRRNKRVAAFKSTPEMDQAIKTMMNMPVDTLLTYASTRSKTGAGVGKLKSLIVQVVLETEAGKRVAVSPSTIKL